MENPTQPTSEATPATHNPHKAEALALIERLRKLEPMLTHKDFTEAEACDAAHGLYRFMRDGLGIYADYTTRSDVRDYCNDSGDAEKADDDLIDAVLSDLDDSEILSERKADLVREYIFDNLDSRKGDAR
jgi:hypothetical protein